MTIRTKYSQILDTIVRVSAVDMVELQWKIAVRRSFCPTAYFAMLLFESCIE